MYDVVVIGAGLGGLMAAAKLSGRGKKVLVLEKKMLPGGTSYVFKRGGYSFPMGPLSFSFPTRVAEYFAEVGIERKIDFIRSGFRLRTPVLDIQMSQPLRDLGVDLTRQFPRENQGIESFIEMLLQAVSVSRDMDRWHPDFDVLRAGRGASRASSGDLRERIGRIMQLSETQAGAVLDSLIGNVPLKNFLGSLGTKAPEMSMLNLASMWNIMAGEGIWIPAMGVHGMADLLLGRMKELSGEAVLSTPVEKILVKNGRASGVMTADGNIIESRRVVSNADYKTTFLGLLDVRDLSGIEIDFVRDIAYTGSELCVYLGFRPERVDLSALRTEHLFFREEIRDGDPDDPEDFRNREIEICFWSRKAPDQAPPGRASLLLRVGFPYDYFEEWRSGEKIRRAGYKEHKTALARKLVHTAEKVLPGLSGAVEIMEAATPLTYRDWGNRYGGSIAGWSWDAGQSRRIPEKILVRSPLPGLFMAGVYAASELFLGGVPTALCTGSLAAELVLEDSR